MQRHVRGSELRLLAITIAVSVVMLLLLARLRFPEARDRAAEPQPAAAPLERLAARATYEELASVLRGVDRQVSPAISIVRATDTGPEGRTVERFLPAVRLSDAYTIALAGPGRRVEPMREATDGAVVLDEPRGLALLQQDPGDTTPPVALADAEAVTAGPGYLAAVEATGNGPVVRPMYFARVRREADARWSAEVLRFDGVGSLPDAGAAVFTLQGTFIGAGLPERDEFVVVPAAVLIGAAARLAAKGPVPAVELGISVQDLDAGLKAAIQESTGVMVAAVSERGPSAGQLEPGDVITAIGGVSIGSVADYAVAVAALNPAQAATVDVRRDGNATSVTIEPAPPVQETSRPEDLGLLLRSIRGRGAEVVRVDAGSVAARAGIHAGDLIVRVGDTSAPAAAAVERAYHDAASGAHLLVRVQRAEAYLFAALAKP